jgi:pimeloyl-ACP methyl ester carboxylesterase
VHGLAETENSWQRRHGEREPYGPRLEAEFGYTPVYVRYNTGLHVSDNGRELAGLLDRLADAWPVQVEEFLLVGHSMGGLVIRSACHHGQEERKAWTELVRHVFYLGSPHLGAPLARAAGFAGVALHRVAETKPFVTLVNGSSSGIKDLRYGYVLASDWADCDLDSCLRDHGSPVPLLAGAGHHNISATVTADTGSPLGAVAGDLLVRPASAHGRRGRRQHIGFPAQSGRWLGGMHHLDLLNHPAVWAAMRGILTAPAPGSACS